jgi:hypothetical protein
LAIQDQRSKAFQRRFQPWLTLLEVLSFGDNGFGQLGPIPEFRNKGLQNDSQQFFLVLHVSYNYDKNWRELEMYIFIYSVANRT